MVDNECNGVKVRKGRRFQITEFCLPVSPGPVPNHENGGMEHAGILLVFSRTKRQPFKGEQCPGTALSFSCIL